MLVAQHEAVAFQCDGQAVGGGARQAGGGDKLTQRGGAGFERVENLHRLVQHANAGVDLRVPRRGGVGLAVGFKIAPGGVGFSSSHNTAIMPSHIVKCQILKISAGVTHLNIWPRKVCKVALTIGWVSRIGASG